MEREHITSTALVTIGRLRSCLSTKVPPNTLATCCAIIDNVPSQPAATVEPDTAYPSRLIANVCSANPAADAVSAVNHGMYPVDCQNDFVVRFMSAPLAPLIPPMLPYCHVFMDHASMGKIPTDVLRKPSEGLQNQRNGFDARLIVTVHACLDLPATYNLIELFKHRAHLLCGQAQHMIIAGA